MSRSSYRAPPIIRNYLFGQYIALGEVIILRRSQFHFLQDKDRFDIARRSP